MKRSLEMTFHPEPKPLRQSPTLSEDSPSQEGSRDNADELSTVWNRSTSTISDATSSTIVQVKASDQQQVRLLSDDDDDDDSTDDLVVVRRSQQDAATVHSRSSSLSAADDLQFTGGRSVTMTTTSVVSESTWTTTSNTQITSARTSATVPVLNMAAHLVPDITVQHASPSHDATSQEQQQHRRHQEKEGAEVGKDQQDNEQEVE